MTNETTNNNNPIDTLAPGTVLNNKYELVKQISNDAMGAVWKAKDRVADRTVALKFVPSELRQNESEMNQIREIFKRVHTLQHPSICALYGLEDGGNLGYYFVTRYLKGETLAQYAERNDSRRNGLPPSNVIRILSWVAVALDHAHRNGVIHCEVHPSNIFLAKTERGAEVLVTGFGLTATIRAAMSRAGLGKINLSGARPYMAPEQWRGQKSTATTDQYSLAVMAYTLLSGHPPFDGTDVEILGNAVLNHKPEPISMLTEGTNAVLQRALAKHGSDRFGSCEEFIKELKEGAPALFDVSSISVNANESFGVAVKAAAADVAFHPAAKRSYVQPSSDSSRIWIIVGCVSALFLLGIIAWGVMGNRDKTPPAEVVVQVAPQPVIVEQVVPPAPPQPAYQSPFRDIFEAAGKGQVRDVEYFIKNGADVRAKDNGGGTPLHHAAWDNSNVEVVKYLISQGADVNAKANSGGTPLIHAAHRHSNVEVVKYLVSQGANVNAKYQDGVTVLHCASGWGHRDSAVVEYLVSHGADVNAKDDAGRTALHHAVRTGDTVNNGAIFQFLISQRADVNARDNEGKTPLDLAKEKGPARLVAYLESVGARSGTVGNYTDNPFAD